ncbi:phospholipase D-like domain-containing protein [Burkholderia sp. WSM2232]|uniref:phospholipase D-like domain-containing protein n=1 Tax=Burkholderia sp. WSM2232 TaxID=944436 RepID=UPI0004143A25|nr:phospholipase D-like domain-containing protein [Burkholderia sp. WSM2232]
MLDVMAKVPPTGDSFDFMVPSLRQIVDKGGEPYKAYGTENIWQLAGQPFAVPKWGNKVTPFTTGVAYFANLVQAIEGATKTVYMAGWQVNWDAQLTPGLGGRLFDVLLKAVTKNRGLNVYVMPWKHADPVQTYDAQTKSVLEAINDLTGRTCVWVTQAKSLADDDSLFFSHHQKFVVIDEQTAFVGGMDVCYGRFDDEHYDLRADAAGRQASNRYNTCIPHVGKISPDKCVDPDLLTRFSDDHYVVSRRPETLARIQAGAFQTIGSDVSTLDELRQPRMPWQDSHVRIDGPSATDVALNFVLRWNSEGGKSKLPLPSTPADQTGGCGVQILRSASARMRKGEYNNLSSREKSLRPVPTGSQREIAAAMGNLISRATSFIYIENQFFVSGFVSEQTHPDKQASDISSQRNLSGPAQLVKGRGFNQLATRLWGVSSHPDEAPKNFICERLGQRIGRAIMSGVKENFHVIITLPVHPEGNLNDASVMNQVHWTMQSLVFGSFSLLNRVRRYLKARELWDKKAGDWRKVLTDVDDRRYEELPIENCREYVTLLNLRNWAKLGDRYVTEQIYIHNKMMIVDDLYAIVGSANINDRSMLGSRDSEIAALIVDSEIEKHDLDGSGHLKSTRKFARQLRQAVWKKIFGITGNVRPASSLQAAIDQPANPANWKEIQAVADANTALYEAAFDFIPRNHAVALDGSEELKPASIWPTWNRHRQTTTVSMIPMPFNESFWLTFQHRPAAVNLRLVKGFITSLPIGWTNGESNNLGFATSLVADSKTSSEKVSPNEALRASIESHNSIREIG